jgi:hypothetical protein
MKRLTILLVMLAMLGLVMTAGCSKKSKSSSGAGTGTSTGTATGTGTGGGGNIIGDGGYGTGGTPGGYPDKAWVLDGLYATGYIQNGEKYDGQIYTEKLGTDTSKYPYGYAKIDLNKMDTVIQLNPYSPSMVLHFYIESFTEVCTCEMSVSTVDPQSSETRLNDPDRCSKEKICNFESTGWKTFELVGMSSYGHYQLIQEQISSGAGFITVLWESGC